MAMASPEGTQPDPKAQMSNMIVMFVILGVMFYFIGIRPQQKQAKRHKELMASLKNGDKIVTNSGIVGTVVNIKDKQVSIRSADSKLEVLKSAISDITERNDAPAAAEKK